MSICSNENNLYDFYRLIGAGKFASLIKGHNYSAVSGNEGSWPQMIFDVCFEENAGLELNKIYSDAAEIPDVRFAVCQREHFTIVDQELLRRKEIFPIGNWKLMEINSKVDFKSEIKDEYNIKRLIKAQEIDEYVSLVNNSLMNGQIVNSELFQELVHHSGIDLYGLFVGDEVVSGLLSYSGSNKVAGLYFIATKENFRGKGMAAWVMENVIMSLFQKGIGKVVLQAVPKAVTLYARLGFLHQGELVIFWKK